MLAEMHEDATKATYLDLYFLVASDRIYEDFSALNSSTVVDYTSKVRTHSNM